MTTKRRPTIALLRRRVARATMELFRHGGGAIFAGGGKVVSIQLARSVEDACAALAEREKGRRS